MNFDILASEILNLKVMIEEKTGVPLPVVLVVPNGELEPFTQACVNHYRISTQVVKASDPLIEFCGAEVKTLPVGPKGKIFLYQECFLMAVFDVKESTCKRLWEDISLQLNQRVDTPQ